MEKLAYKNTTKGIMSKICLFVKLLLEIFSFKEAWLHFLSNKFQRQTILKVKYLLDFGNIFYIEIYVVEQCVLVKSVQPRNVKGKKQKILTRRSFQCILSLSALCFLVSKQDCFLLIRKHLLQHLLYIWS